MTQKLQMMLKQFSLVLSFILLLGVISNAQNTPVISWKDTLSNNSKDSIWCVRQTSDSGYILCGSNQSVGSNGANNDYWIVRITKTGKMKWQKTFGGSGDDVAKSVIQTANGNFAVVGYTNSTDGDLLIKGTSFNNGGYDAWVLVLDSSGKIQGENVYGGQSDDKATSIVQSGSNYVISGFSNSANDGFAQGQKNNNNIGGFDVWLFEIDKSAKTVWNKNFGGTNNDYANSLIQTKDGGFLLAGTSISTDSNLTYNTKGTTIFSSKGIDDSLIASYNYWLVKTDKNGNIQWQKSIGNTPSNNFDYDVAYSAYQTTDSGYIVAGNTGIVKLDKNGNQLWKNTNYTSKKIYEGQIAIQTKDSTAFAIASNGGLYSLNTANTKSKIIETPSDTSLNIINSFTQTKDSGYVIVGQDSINGYPTLIKISSGSTANSITYNPIATAIPNSPIIKSFSGTVYSYGTCLASGDNTTITGKYFLNAKSVKFGTDTATSFRVVDDNTITASVGQIAFPGYITVTSSDGVIGTSITKYYQKGVPVITSFTGTTFGNFGKYLGKGDIITIKGKYLTDVESVKLAGNEATITSVDDSTITAVVGTIDSTLGHVLITNKAGIQVMSTNSFYHGIIVNGFTGTTGPNGNTYLGKGETITITGKYFFENGSKNVSNVTFGGNSALTFNIINDSVLTATVGSISVDSGYISLTPNNTSTDLGCSSLNKFYHSIILKTISGGGNYHYAGNIITITGNYFTGASVLIKYYSNSYPSPQFSKLVIVNDSTINATVGSGGSSGSGTIEISNASESFKSVSSNSIIYNGFLYCPGATGVKSPLMIGATPSNSITSGIDVAFLDTTNNNFKDSSGSIYSYIWYFNGNNYGNSSEYLNSVLKTGDQVYTELTISNCGGTYTYPSKLTSNKITMIVSGNLPNYTWTGRNGTDWKLANNWSNNILPSNTSDIIIPSYPIQSPYINDDSIVMNNLNIKSNINLISLNNTASLTINGKVSGNGFIEGGGILNDVNINGSNFNWTGGVNGYGYTNVILNGNYDTLNTYTKNLTINGHNDTLTTNTVNLINKGASTSLSYLSSVSGILSQTTGSLKINNLQLPSGSEVAPVTGSITGTATVFKTVYQGNREFRDFGAGVANAGSVFNNWQNGGQSSYYYTNGIFITGSNNDSFNYSNDPTNGFDVTLSGNPSMYTYKNSAQSWSAVTNTKTTLLDPYTGYRVLVRGDRSDFKLLYSEKTNKMWSSANIPTTGNLIIGKVTYSTSGVAGTYPSSTCKLAANSFSFVANPYHSPVSWSKVLADSKNINASYWYQDPTIYSLSSDSGYTQIGTTYVSYNKAAGVNSNPEVSRINDNLQPGQAFFVLSTNASPSLVFNETSKSGGGHLDIFGITTPINKLALTLHRKNHNVDGAVYVFGSGFSKAIGDEDTWKFTNSGENISLLEAGKDLAIEGLPLPINTDSLPIHLYNLQPNTSYSIKINAAQFNSNGLQTYFKDGISNTTTLLSGDSTIVSFNTLNDTSAFSNRYSIIFGGNTLPINSIVATATENGDDAIVKWTATETNKLNVYTVQRSLDGKSFTDLAILETDKRNNIYLDASTPLSFGIYYRIKAVYISGVVIYSNITKLNENYSLISSLSAFPNPVVGNSLNIKMGNLPTNFYKIKIIDLLGKQVASKSIFHKNGAIENISLNSKLIAGNYTLETVDNNGDIISCKIEVK